MSISSVPLVPFSARRSGRKIGSIPSRHSCQALFSISRGISKQEAKRFVMLKITRSAESDLALQARGQACRALDRRVEVSLRRVPVYTGEVLP